MPTRSQDLIKVHAPINYPHKMSAEESYVRENERIKVRHLDKANSSIILSERLYKVSTLWFCAALE